MKHDADAPPPETNVTAAGEPISSNGGDDAVFDVELSPRYRLAMLARLWTSATEKIYEAQFGVSLSEWRLIAIIGREPAITAGAIADRGLLKKPHISRLVARLIERGLIASERDSVDARRSWLTLTEEGRRIFSAIAPLSAKRDREFLSTLSRREEEVLNRLLDKLLLAAPAFRD